MSGSPETFLGLSAPLWQALGLTVKLAATTTLILGIVGLPLARWLNTSRRRITPYIETLVALPIVLPPTVIGFYLLTAFSPQPPPGSWWQSATGTPLAFTFTGLVIASVFYSLPFAVQPFQAALRGVPVEMLDAAATLGTPATTCILESSRADGVARRPRRTHSRFCAYVGRVWCGIDDWRFDSWSDQSRQYRSL